MEDRMSSAINWHTPEGFSKVKGEPNYWLDAVRDFWDECDMDTDEMELVWIVNWFDERRKKNARQQNAENGAPAAGREGDEAGRPGGQEPAGDP